MKPTRWRFLVLLALGAGAVTWALLALLRTRGAVPELASWAVVIVLLCATGAVITSGWPVRQYVRDPAKHRIDPLRAARVAALGKSAAIGGAVLLGFYSGQAIIEATAAVIRGPRLWPALAAAGCSMLLTLAGMLVEGFCKLPPPPDATDGAPGGEEQPGRA